MEIDEKKTVAFSLMATLNNTSRNIFSCVYMPIFKYGLSQYCKAATAGQDRDLQESISTTVGITIPLLTIRKMLNTLNEEINRKEKSRMGFNIMERGKSFQIVGFEYREIDEIVKNERRKINALNQAFVAYCPDCDESESFNEFIKYNFSKLSGFFSSRKVIDLDGSQLSKYRKQAEFLKYIEGNNPDLFEIAKNAYIGSFITVLLETGFVLEAKGSDSIGYYLDTRIVLSALNLQTELEYITSNELLDLVRKNNGLLYVMDQTIEEIEFNVSNAIEYFDANPAIDIINNSSINAAALRNGLSRTDLQLMLKNIRRIINDKLEANVINVPQTVIDKSKKSDDLKVLERIRDRKPATALHDIIAIYYVRELRGGFIANHKKVKTWFVTDNDGLYNFDTRIIPANNAPEVVLTEDLAFLLWLKDIDKGNAPFLQTGLKEYISRIMVSDLPDYVILDDLYDNIRKYKETDPEAAHDLMDSLAHASLTQIKSLNVLAEKEPDAFSRQIDEIKREKEAERARLEKGIAENKQKEEENIGKLQSLIEANDALKNAIVKIESELLPEEKNKNIALEISIKQMERRNAIYKKIAITSITTPILCLSAYIAYKYLGGFLKIIVSSITSLGGLWGFINLIINISKSIGKK